MAQDPLFPVSPAELMMHLVLDRTSRDIVPHATVGPMNEEQLREGGVQISTAGATRPESVGLIYPRIQIRCIASELADAERMARYVYESLHGTHRAAVTQDSGDTWLIHGVQITGGPSDHFDTSETWEGLMFADTMIGTVPVPSS